MNSPREPSPLQHTLSGIKPGIPGCRSWRPFPSACPSVFLSRRLTCIPGVIHYNDAKIQLLDLPGIIEGAAEGRGECGGPRGRDESLGDRTATAAEAERTRG